MQKGSRKKIEIENINRSGILDVVFNASLYDILRWFGVVLVPPSSVLDFF
jgi:hypothetical protein